MDHREAPSTHRARSLSSGRPSAGPGGCRPFPPKSDVSDFGAIDSEHGQARVRWRGGAPFPLPLLDASLRAMKASQADTLEKPRVPNPAALKRRLVADARAEGFELVGVTTPDAIPEAAPRLAQFLAEGQHGTMDWLEAKADRRASPRALWPEAQAVIMLGLNYGPDTDPLATLAQTDRATVSVYARHRDYHDLIKGKLKRIAGRFAVYAKSDVKVFVDTAPLMEKPLAEAAGLGWQGKHTNLVSRDYGSWLFLGAILTEVALPHGRARNRPLRHLPRLPRHLPDKRLSGALPARCPPLHLLSHHRAGRADPARIPPCHRQPHLWLRRLPGRLPVEQVRAGDPRGETQSPRRPCRSASGRPRRARRCRIPRPIRRLADQAHRPRPLPAQHLDRHRQFRLG